MVVAPVPFPQQGHIYFTQTVGLRILLGPLWRGKGPTLNTICFLSERRKEGGWWGGSDRRTPCTNYWPCLCEQKCRGEQKTVHPGLTSFPRWNRKHYESRNRDRTSHWSSQNVNIRGKSMSPYYHNFNEAKKVPEKQMYESRINLFLKQLTCSW